MFERSDLEKINFSDNRLPYYRGLYSTSYYQYAFEVPDSEERISISRAPKMEGDNGLRFWLAAELLDNWSNRMECFKTYILGSDFKKLSESEFNAMVSSQCSSLITKPSIPLGSGEFIGALAMWTLEREFIVDLFAEFENEYLHFLWETTA